MSHDYQHLLAPGKIGNLQLRNRMIVSSMGVNLAEADGSCGEPIPIEDNEFVAGCLPDEY